MRINKKQMQQKNRFCDLCAAKQIFYVCEPIRNGKLYTDRAYIDVKWNDTMKKLYNIDILLIVKAKRNIWFSKMSIQFPSVLSVSRSNSFQLTECQVLIQLASHIHPLQGLFFHVLSTLTFANLLISNACFDYWFAFVKLAHYSNRNAIIDA